MKKTKGISLKELSEQIGFSFEKSFIDSPPTLISFSVASDDTATENFIV